MSRDKTMVPTNFLDWPRVVNLLPELKFIGLFLWSFKDIGCCGAGFVAIGGFASSVSIKAEAVESGFKILEEAGLILWDEETYEIFILDWFRFHTFKTSLSHQMLAASINKIQSEKIRNAVTEKAKQIILSSTPPTQHDKKGSGTPDPKNKQAVEIFLGEAGSPDSLLPHKQKLAKELGNSSPEQARLAGIAWREAWMNGKIEDEIAFAIGLCRRAVQGEVTPGKLADDQGKTERTNLDEQVFTRLEALHQKRFLLPDGQIAIVDRRAILIGGGTITGKDALKYFTERIETGEWPPVD